MVQSITAAVTQSVLGELQKAGIFAGHPDQQQDIELSQTVATASPDEAQRTTSANTTTINNIEFLQLPAMLFANTSKKPDGCRVPPFGTRCSKAPYRSPDGSGTRQLLGNITELAVAPLAPSTQLHIAGHGQCLILSV